MYGLSKKKESGVHKKMGMAAETAGGKAQT